MAVVNESLMTLADHASRVGDDGKTQKIVELMSRTNEIMEDMVMKPSNMDVGEKITIRTGLPEVTWRKINKGVVPGKSRTKQLTFTPGRCEAIAEIDEMLLEGISDPAGLRTSEAVANIEAMTQELAHKVFYGDLTEPESFLGLSHYYDHISALETDIGRNVISAGGAGDDNTSLWLVVWSTETLYGFFPKGSKAGIENNPGKDKEWLLDDDRGRYKGYRDQYVVRQGLVPRDWRYAVRVANIDVSALDSAGDAADTSANLIKLAIKALNLVPSLNMGRAAWYCNRQVKTALDVKAQDKHNVSLTISNLEDGRPLTRLYGIPVRRCDALVNTESVVSA